MDLQNLISQETFETLLQTGGQYLIPAAALLRALYSGIRGKLPEGFAQIAVASMFAGVTAVIGQEQLDFRSILLGILGNTLFTAGLLAFIMTYLLRVPYYGQIADGIIGAISGLVFFLVWGYLLGNAFEWWLLPVTVIGGALAFIALRTLLRQIAKLVKIATYFIVAGLVLAVGGGAILLVITLVNAGTGTG